MSHHLTFTIDEFMQLGPQAHRTAVALFTQEIDLLRRLAKLDVAGSPDELAHRATLNELVQLRKVHQGRLEELEAEAEAALAGCAETHGATVALAACA